MNRWIEKWRGRRAGSPSDAPDWPDAARGLGFTLHDSARAFLDEHYGRQHSVPIDGAPDYRGFVDFTPQNVCRFLDRGDVQNLQRLMGAPLCPIGTTGGHTVFLFLDPQGKSYALDMEWTLYAPLASSAPELLELLCGGANGRVDSFVLDDNARPTGQVIRTDNERSFWSPEEFEQVAAYLPATSLSPCRRPPTWRPLVKAAAQVLSQGGDPGKILVTCGGFTRAPSGQAYFVAHCENSLFVRDRAGFQVAAPPPGVPASLRPGECVPVTAPNPGR